MAGQNKGFLLGFAVPNSDAFIIRSRTTKFFIRGKLDHVDRPLVTLQGEVQPAFDGFAFFLFSKY